jgi:hypothetical protein
VKPATGGVTAAGTASTPRAPSTERETCAATADCVEGLACVDAVCRPRTTSRLGHYHWAAGEAAAAKKDFATATVEFQEAIGLFRAETKVVPTELSCAYGAALRRKPNDAKAWEQAARLLHRCVLDSPPGSAAFRAAMSELVELEAVGLDPAVLANTEEAPAYLTRAAKKTTPDKPALEVQQTNPSRDKGYEAFINAVRGVEPQLDKCWSAYVEASQKTTLSVVLDLKYRVVLGDDDLVVGAKLEIESAPGLGGHDATAAQCVKDALAPAVAEFGKNLKLSSGSWKGSVTVVLKPPA